MKLIRKALGEMSRRSNTGDYFHFKTVMGHPRIVKLFQV